MPHASGASRKRVARILLRLRSRSRAYLRRAEFTLIRPRNPSGAWRSPLKKLPIEGLRGAIQGHFQPLLAASDVSKLAHRAAEIDAGSRDLTLRQAERMLGGRIRVFTSEYDVGRPVDWSRDPRSGHAWPLDYHADLTLIDLKNDADVRIVWEMNRCHQFVDLGKAYAYTGDEKYAAFFRGEILEWARSNPVERGVNWACPMEAAIRAVNFAWAYGFFLGSAALDRDFHLFFLSLLEAHGTYIASNLENLGVPRGNHYVADLVGLLFLGTLLPWSSRARRWTNVAVRELKREMAAQVHGDGMNFEGSIPYHRLVAELFLHAAILAGKMDCGGSSADPAAVMDSASRTFGNGFIRKLELMCEAVTRYTRPDGLSPQIGDADDGRLVKLGNPSRDVNDHRHLCAVAGELFNRADFRDLGGPCREEALWLFGRLPAQIAAPKEAASGAFPDSGIYVMRRGPDYAIVRCADLATGGKGTHSHSDSLSLELCFRGVPYIVDPGTYVYSGAPELRNLLRSTRSHNTVILDGMEQNEPSAGDLFTMRSRSHSRVLRWRTGGETDVFRGALELHRPDGAPVGVERQIRFMAKSATWQMTDAVRGPGNHVVEWRFHASPSVTASVREGRAVLEAPGGGLLEIRPRESCRLQLGIEEGMYSSGYGRMEPIRVIVFSTAVSGPAIFGFFIGAPRTHI